MRIDHFFAGLVYFLLIVYSSSFVGLVEFIEDAKLQE